MFRPSNRLVILAAFTVVLVVLVNFSWWFYYKRTEGLLEDQLSRRLAAIARLTSLAMSAEQVDSLVGGEVLTYIEVASFLEDARASDSLSEVFILDENHVYLATTLVEPDSVYFLSLLNGRYIDSVLLDPGFQTVVSPTYRTGQLRLKSAFSPLYGSDGLVAAVLGIEASVDYFDSMSELRSFFIYSTSISLIGGLCLGLLFIVIQRRLNRAEQNVFLGQTHAHLGRMVAVVAHELKNPLMIMRGSAERLVRKTASDEARYVVEEVDRLNEIVSGYLEFARAGTGLTGSEQRSTFELAELTTSLQKHLVDKYAPNPVEWLGEELSPGMTISGYPRSLRQVLLNLLINGADACLAGSKPIQINIAARFDRDRIKIEISDKGVGIPARELKTVFDPFHTTKQDGSGLGLYLSKKIVEEMGGSINIISRPGQGTTIELDLPREVKN